jgi:O-succinylbenzoic acid--CoA ligase
MLAQHLAAQGVDAGDTLALVSASSGLTVLLLYASSQLDAAFYPIDPRTPTRWRDNLLEQAAVDYVIRHEADDGLFDIDAGSLNISAVKRAVTARNRNPGVAAILATSGSSGEPKGVLLGHESVGVSAGMVNRKLGVLPEDCWLNCLPLYHVGGLSIVFRSARAGASMVLQQGFDAERVWSDINRRPVTHVSLVPAMLAMLLDEAQQAPPERLRILLVGGAALSKKLARRALDTGWPLCVTYGMSETASQVATQCLRESGEWDCAAGPAATLLPGVECEVVDESGAPTQAVGKIRLRSRCLMIGYANPERRVGDGLDPEGWFTTSDLGRLDENNCICIIGRSDETLISGGENLHPLEAEMLMLDCPGVDTVCVIGVDDPVWGQMVCAIYTGPFNELEVKRWCRAELPGPLRPRRFVRLRRLPQLSNGKIDRFSLKRAYGR